VLVRALWPDSAYVWFFGVALFGALFVWLMIFVTHIAFRASTAAGGRGGAPLTSYAGALLVGGILVSTWWVPGLESTVVAGGPWLLLLAIGYRLSPARARA
jgi:L-asparagine transporter-like permease